MGRSGRCSEASRVGVAVTIPPVQSMQPVPQSKPAARCSQRSHCLLCVWCCSIHAMLWVQTAWSQLRRACSHPSLFFQLFFSSLLTVAQWPLTNVTSNLEARSQPRRPQPRSFLAHAADCRSQEVLLCRRSAPDDFSFFGPWTQCVIMSCSHSTCSSDDRATKAATEGV